jgi:hypothetical protein
MRAWYQSGTIGPYPVAVDELVGATQVYLRLLARLSA